MWRPFLLALHLITCSSFVFASDLKIEGIEWSSNGKDVYKAKFTITWNNSRRNDRNYDAVWVFLKYITPPQNTQYRHASLMSSGHRLLQNHYPASPVPVFEIPEDHTGIFIYPSSRYRGNIRWTVELALDTAILREPNFNSNSRLLNVYGIEMVQIPEAGFTIGEADTAAAWNNYALFTADENGRPCGLWKINSESEPIPVGKEKGKLYYNSQTTIYQGDQKGIISPSFPKGFQAFYIMKYETTQAQYADFLNCLSNAATASRANFAGRDYYTFRGTFILKTENIQQLLLAAPAIFLAGMMPALMLTGLA